MASTQIPERAAGQRPRSSESRLTPYESTPTYPWGRELPLVGRRAQLESLRLALDSAYDGRGHTLFLNGESGVGKTRLVRELVGEANARGFAVAIGSAFAVESRSAYGLLANALLPLLSAMDPASLAVLTRGLEGDLYALLPGLAAARAADRVGADPDLRARLHWNFVQFIKRLTARRPLLLVYDNAHWSDPSSLEVAHFLARQIKDAALLLVLTSSADESEITPQLRSIERSLLGIRAAVVHSIDPLTPFDTTELLQRVFGFDAPSAEAHGNALHRHTAGNTFFSGGDAQGPHAYGWHSQSRWAMDYR